MDCSLLSRHHSSNGQKQISLQDFSPPVTRSSTHKRKCAEQPRSKVPSPKRAKVPELNDESFLAEPNSEELPPSRSKTNKKSGKAPHTTSTKATSRSEKRLRRFRSHAPQAYLEKLVRAQTQRMFVLDRTRSTALDKNVPMLPSAPVSASRALLDQSNQDDQPLSETFLLAGTTGNVYNITISSLPTCTCPDYRKNRSQCKHIIYVLTNILKVREDLAYQLAFLRDELTEIFETAPLPSVGIKPNEEGNGGDKRKAIDGDCPICFMSMDPKSGEDFLWCKSSCGQNVHRECFEKWAKSSVASNGKVRCVYCRAEWEGDETSIKRILEVCGGKLGREGYINVGERLGFSRKRDYSTYHGFWVRQQIRRGRPEEDEEDYAEY